MGEPRRSIRDFVAWAGLIPSDLFKHDAFLAAGLASHALGELSEVGSATVLPGQRGDGEAAFMAASAFSVQLPPGQYAEQVDAVTLWIARAHG